MSKPTRPSLRQRVSGPNAVPIAMLVERGAKAAERANSQFQDFARERVHQLELLMAKIAPTAPQENWVALEAAVQDLRSSAATGGQPALSRMARSWEKALSLPREKETKLVAVMNLHLDALRNALAHTASAEESRAVAERLEAMVAHLGAAAP